MTIPVDFDLEVFQADVIKEIELLEALMQSQGELADYQTTLESQGDNIRKLPEFQQAEADLKRPELRTVICAGLKDFSGNAVKLAMTLTPVLVGAALGGVITISLTPLYVGLLTLLVANMGVSSLCVGVETGDKKD